MTTTAIGFLKDLPLKHVMRAVIHDTDLAVWRSESGQLAAWENRCPHRGMRLSHGFVRGESLACMYHGWQFGGNGQCHYIPALPTQTPSDAISTKSYAIKEANDLLWVSLSGDVEPPFMDDTLKPLRSMSFDCEPENLQRVVLENTPTELITDAPLSVNVDDRGMIHIQSADITDVTEITIVLQSQTTGSVNTHIMVNKQWSKQRCIEMSRWCEHIRRIAEANSPILNTGAM